MTKKLFNKLAVIDGSYMLHRSLKQPDLWELRGPNGERTGGIYGFLKVFNSEIKNLDYYPVVVWDAGLSDRRLSLYPDYKRNLSKTIETVATNVLANGMSIEEAIQDQEFKLSKIMKFSDEIEEIRKRVNEQIDAMSETEIEIPSPDDDYLSQYRRQRAVLIDILSAFGIPSIKINGWEGDDLMTLATRISTESVVLTDDKDMKQLVAPNIKIYRPMAKQWFTMEDLGNYSDIDDPNSYTQEDIVAVKAIVGDPSDNIPSVTHDKERKYSLGEGRAWGVAKIIRQCNNNPELYLKELADTGKNYYKGFIDNHDIYLRNKGLVDLSMVEDDKDIISQMEATILQSVGKSNLFQVLGLLGNLGINNIDVNGLISKIIMVSPTVYLGGDK